jgi:hypothetical protein
VALVLRVGKLDLQLEAAAGVGVSGSGAGGVAALVVRQAMESAGSACCRTAAGTRPERVL